MKGSEIQKIKDALGDKVCIVGHHYQHEDVIKYCDITGDSLELARKVALETAPHIVFCGVYFMAESGALLAREGQNIYIPDPKANCDMSLMTPAPLLEKITAILHEKALAEGRKIVPLAYVNTSLAVKDVVGRYGGAVCTSANAKTMLKWALDTAAEAENGGYVLFLPDRNLAQNMAVQLGMTANDWHVLNVEDEGAKLDMQAISQAKMLLWPGYCPIHEEFTTEHIAAFRREHADCTVVVHPESPRDVVGASDGSGSTTYLIEAVKNSPKGSTIIVGTECNLVERLRVNYAHHCTVIPLRSVYCADMGLITEAKLLKTLQDIQNGTAEPVRIPSEQISSAKSSLERMLDVCSKAGV